MYKQNTAAAHFTLIIKKFPTNGVAQLTCSWNIFPELHQYAT